MLSVIPICSPECSLKHDANELPDPPGIWPTGIYLALLSSFRNKPFIISLGVPSPATAKIPLYDCKYSIFYSLIYSNA